MEEEARRVLAAAIVEAFETGNPVAPLPPALRPADALAGEAVAEEVLEALGLAPCGLRIAPAPGGSWLAGPMLGTRLLRDGATLAVAALRHPRASAAAIGVLAAPLDPEGSGPPAFAAVHPALDIATSRFRDGPAGPGEEAADLAGLGFVLAGRPGRAPDAPVAASCAAEPKRPRGRPVDLAGAFLAAADAARRLGGLPAGALLVVAGLTPPETPAAEEAWVARLSGLGRARAVLASTPQQG
jgi:hypothetical protein